MIEVAAVSWLTIDDPNFWTDLVRFAAPGAVLLLVVWVLFLTRAPSKRVRWVPVLPGSTRAGWPTKEAVLTTNTSAKATLHQRAMHELKELAIISAYLYVTLGAVIMMKTAVLRTEGGVEFIPWGIAIVKAVVLGKFVLLGNLVHVGGRNTTRPLIWPTLRRAFAFLVLLIVLTIIEEAVVGLFHHRSIAASLGELFGARLEETLAGYLIMLLVLIPFFAFRVLSEALGEGRLERMFFIAREPERK